MNKKNLIITSVKNMSRAEWLDFRKPLTHVNKLLQEHKVKSYKQCEEFFLSDTWKSFVFPCVGGSETASVMGLNPYKAVIEIFYEKVGVVPTFDNDKEIMFWGRELEAQIAQKWKFWDGSTVDNMIENFKAKKVQRTCQKVNAYLQNVNFAWLFVSLDYKINKHTFTTAEGKVVTRPEGALEVKTMSGFAAKMWENGLPPMYVVQNQSQLHVCTFSWGEIATLKDGREFDVLPFDFNANIANAIENKTKGFFERVKKGIEHFVLASKTDNEALKAEHLHQIDMLAPEADGSEAYKNYLSNRFKDKGFSKKGGQIEFELAEQYNVFKDECKAVEYKQTEVANKLKSFMGEASEIDFGEKGKVTWKENSKGSRTFNVSLKKPK